MIRIVNLHNYHPKENEVLIKVDRTTVVGNMFHMRDKSQKERDRVCDLYENYFEYKYSKNKEFHDYIENIYLVSLNCNVALGCWCYPKRCHAETILKFIEKLKGEQNEFIKFFKEHV